MLGLRVLLAPALKLGGHPMMVAEFRRIGLGRGFCLFTGTLEGIAALMLPWRRATTG